MHNWREYYNPPMKKIRNIQQHEFLNVLTKGSEWNIIALSSCCSTCTQCRPPSTTECSKNCTTAPLSYSYMITGIKWCRLTCSDHLMLQFQLQMLSNNVSHKKKKRSCRLQAGTWTSSVKHSYEDRKLWISPRTVAIPNIIWIWYIFNTNAQHSCYTSLLSQK